MICVGAFEQSSFCVCLVYYHTGTQPVYKATIVPRGYVLGMVSNCTATNDLSAAQGFAKALENSIFASLVFLFCTSLCNLLFSH